MLYNTFAVFSHTGQHFCLNFRLLFAGTEVYMYSKGLTNLISGSTDLTDLVFAESRKK